MRPPLRYFGGKWRIAPWIIAHLPLHNCYVKTFGGGASVLLRKPPSSVEVYNDIADAAVNFFRVLRDDGMTLRQRLQYTPFAREEFQAARQSVAVDPIERARCFFVESAQGMSGVNGDYRSHGWRKNIHRNVAREMADRVDTIELLAQRLRRVAIEHLDWRVVLQKYDTPQTCFYLDPPYLLATRRSPSPSNGYGKNDFTAADHEELLAAVVTLQGSVVISGYAHPLYDAALRDWQRCTHSAATNGDAATEVLWINRPVAQIALPIEGRGDAAR